MNKLFKSLMVVALAFMLVLPVAVSAQLDFGESYAAGIGLGEEDPRDMAANLIQIILGFLGILAVIIILIGGFKWMTAGGNEDQVAEAKKIIIAGIIGLVIILASWGIASFVLDRLVTVTGA